MSTPGFSASLFLANEADTTSFGASLAPLLRPGDTLLLEGPIGAGKTHMARALIQASLGRVEDVPSPTYTLVQTYDAPDSEIWHADLYRVGSSDELEELGLLDAFDAAVVIIEWPDRLGDLAPDDALWLRFSPEGDGRRLEIRSASPRWTFLEDLLAHV